MKVVIFVDSEATNRFPGLSENYSKIIIQEGDGLMVLLEQADDTYYKFNVQCFVNGDSDVIRIYHKGSDNQELNIQRQVYDWTNNLDYSKTGGPAEEILRQAANAVSKNDLNTLLTYLRGSIATELAIVVLWNMALAFQKKGEIDSIKDITRECFQTAMKISNEAHGFVQGFFKSFKLDDSNEAKKEYSKFRSYVHDMINKQT
jgi:hypothetical protein